MMLCAGRRSTLYDQLMEAAADRAAHSPGNWPDAWGPTATTCSSCSGGLSGAAEDLRAAKESVPLDTLPFFPPYSAGGHRAHAWSVDYDGVRVLVLGGGATCTKG